MSTTDDDGTTRPWVRPTPGEQPAPEPDPPAAEHQSDEDERTVVVPRPRQPDNDDAECTMLVPKSAAPQQEPGPASKGRARGVAREHAPHPAAQPPSPPGPSPASAPPPPYAPAPLPAPGYPGAPPPSIPQHGAYPAPPGYGPPSPYGYPPPPNPAPYGPILPPARGRAIPSKAVLWGALGLLAAAVLLIGVTIAVTKPSFLFTTKLDINSAQTEVAHVLTDAITGYGDKNVANVTCNNGHDVTVKQGDSFTCQATVDGATHQVTVTFLDDNGNYEVGRPD